MLNYVYSHTYMFYVKNTQGDYIGAAKMFITTLAFAVPVSILVALLIKTRILIELVAQKSGVELSSTSTVEQVLNKAPVRLSMTFTVWVLAFSLLFIIVRSFAKRMRAFYIELDPNYNNYSPASTVVGKAVHRLVWVGATFLGFMFASMAVLLQLWWANDALAEITRMQTLSNVAIFLLRCVIVGTLLSIAKVVFFAAHSESNIA